MTIKLPKVERGVEEWQATTQALTLVAEQNGSTIFARIACVGNDASLRARVRLVAQREASGTAGAATRCPNTGVEISELQALWEKYGSPEVVTWDMDKHSMPVARS